MKNNRYWFALAIALAGPISLLACLDEDIGPTPTAPASSTAYRGVLSGAHETGVLDVKVSDGSTSATKALANGSPLSVTATLQLQGQTVSMTGTFDPTSGAFSLSGGGYTLTGRATSSGISGTYTGPNGSGTFVLLPASPTAQPAVFCGSFDGDDTGVWNVTGVSGGAAVGAWASRSGSTGTFAGDWASSGALTLKGDPVSASGTLQSSGAGNGTWQSTAGKQGKWSTGQCQLGGPSTNDAGADATVVQEAGTDATVGRDGSVDETGTGTDGGVDTDATTGADGSSGGDSSVPQDDGSAGTDGGTGADASAGGDSGLPLDDSGTGGSDSGTGGSDASVGVDSGATDAGVVRDASAGGDGGTGGSDASVGLDAGADAGPANDWQEIYSGTNLCALAADGSYVYVGFCKNGGIVKFPISAGDAGAPVTVVGAAYPLAMTISGSTIYWLDNDGHLESAPTGSTSASGTQLAPSSIDTGTGSLYVTGGNAYWVNGGWVNANPSPVFVGSIQKVPTTGGTPVSLVSNVTSLGTMAVASDGYAYYSAGTEYRRVSTNADAGASELVKAATVRNVQFADNGNLYWSEGDTWIRMFPGQTEQTGQALPSLTSFEVASDFLYYRNTSGMLYKGNAFSSVTLTPVSSDNTVGSYVISGGYVYWISNASKLRRASW